MQTIPPRTVDLGGLEVRRLLPRAGRRMVGPWCFLDLIGPIGFARPAMDVPPHPHIGLQTVSWLLEGEMLHKDSLGSEALVVPGTLNLMTSGRGIAHSEETPARHSGRLHALQLWVALPDAHRHAAPAFAHYAERPVVDIPGARASVILGDLANRRAEGLLFSPLVAAEVTLDGQTDVVVPLASTFEHAVLPLDGECLVDGQPLALDHLAFLPAGREELRLRRAAGRRVLLIGGEPFTEPIVMWWNFVARTGEEIADAREDWQAHRRFGEVSLYAGARLEAPAYRAHPVPANPMS